jgi:Trypsin-like peptidase domain
MLTAFKWSSLFCLIFVVTFVPTYYLREVVRAHVPVDNSLESWYGSTVRVQTSRGYGSGVEGRYRGCRGVLTAAHVVSDEDTRHVEVIGLSGREEFSRNGLVVKVDVRNDLAWIILPGRADQVLPNLTPDEDVVLGESIAVIGNGAHTRTWVEYTQVGRSLWTANFSKFDDVPKGIEGFVISGKVWYGHSGGPVLSRHPGFTLFPVWVLKGVVTCSATEELSRECVDNSPTVCQGPSKIREFLDSVTELYGGQ